jgi:hypothetical protein
MGEIEMELEKKKERLRLLLILAIAMGCSSATLGGTFAAFDHAGRSADSAIASPA